MKEEGKEQDCPDPHLTVLRQLRKGIDLIEDEGRRLAEERLWRMLMIAIDLANLKVDDDQYDPEIVIDP